MDRKFHKANTTAKKQTLKLQATLKNSEDMIPITIGMMLFFTTHMIKNQKHALFLFYPGLTDKAIDLNPILAPLSLPFSYQAPMKLAG